MQSAFIFDCKSPFTDTQRFDKFSDDCSSLAILLLSLGCLLSIAPVLGKPAEEEAEEEGDEEAEDEEEGKCS